LEPQQEEYPRELSRDLHSSQNLFSR
jgi:hypothetical protein